MTFSPVEQERLKTGIARLHKFTTYEWRYLFEHILGRPVTLAETDQFLREDFAEEKELTTV